MCRPNLAPVPSGVRKLDESLQAIWTLKRELIEERLDVPHVVDEKPVVCAWYPTAGAVLLWNLSEQRETLRLQLPGNTAVIEVNGLDTRLVSLNS